MMMYGVYSKTFCYGTHDPHLQTAASHWALLPGNETWLAGTLPLLKVNPRQIYNLCDLLSPGLDCQRVRSC